MKDPYGLHRQTLPIAYPQIVFEIAEERGLNAEQVLQAADLPSNLLQSSDGYITRMRPTAHGFLGYALISCSSLREAMQLSLRFMRIRQRHIRAEYFSEGDKGIVRLHERHSFGPVRHFFIEGMLIGVARSVQYLVGDEKLNYGLWLDYPEPEYFDQHRKALPQLRFDMPEVRIEFTEADLDRPLRMADRFASQQAIEQCERELARLGDSPELIPEVRAMLEDNIQSPPGLETVASRLFMSPRTLKRKLKIQGSNYQRLLDEVRFSSAKQLLGNPQLNLQQVGEQLGYAEPASFTRAFRKWAGETPRTWRNRHISP